MTARRPIPRPALVATATVALLALAGCGNDDGTSTADDPASASGSSSASTDPSASSASSAATSTSATSSADAHTEIVYDIGSTPEGPRLYREFRSATGDASVESALTALTDPPTDPDYRTLWSAGAFGTATVTDGQIDVVLADQTLADRPADLSVAQARLAIQQVVYTAQTAAQRRLPVQFLLGDAPAARVLGVPTADPVAAGDEISTLALVNVTIPQQGQAVGGSFTASGFASSFEGSVPWQILDASGKKVLQGSGQGTMDFSQLTPWQATVDVSSLAPGDYTFVAMTDDPTGGTEGPGPTSDTKAITVS